MTDTAVVGFLLVDKPSGITSHTVVARVRKALGTRRVGHGGTLDPMATGLLIVGVGRATRLLGYVAGQTKQYTATIRLGSATFTDDAEGELVGETVSSTHLSTEEISLAMTAYLGTIQQVPSSVSAIKVDGKRSYARLRAGEEVELKSREVCIDQFSLLTRRDESPWVDVDVVVDCSSGTYIRALARDLGRDLGVGGHLTALRRTRIGGFTLDLSCDLDSVGVGSLITMGQMAPHIAPVVEVSETQLRDIAVGRKLPVTLETKLASMMYDNELVALYEPDEFDLDVARPVAVFIDSPMALLDLPSTESTNSDTRPSSFCEDAPPASYCEAAPPPSYCEAAPPPSFCGAERLAESRLASSATAESGPCDFAQGDGEGCAGTPPPSLLEDAVPPSPCADTLSPSPCAQSQGPSVTGAHSG